MKAPAILSFFALAAIAPVSAQTVVKANNTTALNDPLSWVSGGPPGPGNIAVWDATVGANSSPLGGSMTWGGIRITNPGGNATISATAGAMLSLGSSGIDLSASTRNLTINADFVPVANQTWNVAASRSLTLAAQSGGAGITITRTGDGTVNFNNTAANSTFGANLLLNGGLTRAVNASGTQEFSGWLSGSGAFAKTGNGTLVLAGNNFDFSGTFALSGGALHLTNPNVFGTAALTVSAAAGAVIDNTSGAPLTLATASQQVWAANLTFTGTHDLNLGTSAVTVTGDRTLTVSAGKLGISGSLRCEDTGGATTNSLVKAGPGTLELATGADVDMAYKFAVTGGLVRIAGGTLACGTTSGSFEVGGADIELTGGTLAARAIVSTASPATFLFDGGTLTPVADATAFFGGFSNAWVAAGGAKVELDGYNITIAQPLTHDPALGDAPDGGLRLTDSFGTGTLTLTGACSYTGPTVITAGTLQVGNGGTTGSLGFGPVTNHGSLAFNFSTDRNLDQTITGSGSLIKRGAGTLTVDAVNTYTGRTMIESGTLLFPLRQALYGGNSALWTAEKLVVGNGATASFLVGGPGEFTEADIGLLASLGTNDGGFMNGASIGFDPADNLVLGLAISDPNGGANSLGLAKLGPGTLTLTGASSYSGPTTLRGGTLALAGGNNPLPAATTLNFAATSTLDLGTTANTIAGLAVAGGVNAAVVGAGGSLTAGGTVTVNDNSTVTVNGGASLVLTGTTSHPILTNITWNANGNLTVNTYSVATTGGGTGSGQTYTNTLNVNAGAHANITTLNGATVGRNRITNRFLLNVAAGGEATVDTIQNFTNPTGQSVGNTAENRVTVSGVLHVGSITGNSGWSQGGEGGNSRRYITINPGGRINATAITIGTQIDNRTQDYRILIDNGTLANRSGTDLTVNGGLTVFEILNNAVIDISATRTGTVFAPISSSGNLVKVGDGELVLTATNTYTGTTAVSAGTLRINGGSLAASSAVSVAAGATLGGSGTAAGPVTVAAGANLAPGAGAAATGTFGTGALGLAGTYQCQIDGTNADRIAVSGNLDLTGASLQVAVLAAPTAGSYVIASYTGTRTGTFASVPSGYTVSYSTPGQIVLTVGEGDPYGDWASSKGLTAANNGRNQDPDGDGVSNWLEFYLGGEPLSANSAILPKVVAINATTVTFGFSRLDAAEAAFPVQIFQYGSNLAGWTPVTIGSSGGNGPNGIVVGVAENGANPDWITVVIPRALAVGGKLFGRLYLSEQAP